MTARADSFAEMQRRIAELTVTETAPDNVVRATVRSSGALLGIELSPQVRGMNPAHLAALVTRCVQRAQAAVAKHVEEIARATVGNDPAANVITTMVRDQFPEPPPVAAGPRPGPAPALRPTPPPPAQARPVRRRGGEDEEWEDRTFMRPV